VISSNSEKLFENGLAAFNRGDFVAALGFFQKARSLDPDVPAVHHNIGMAYMKLGDFKEAEKNLLKALRLDASYGFALIGLANLRVQEHKLREAWEPFTTAAEMYLASGIPSNSEESSYFLSTFANLMEAGMTPKGIGKVMNDLLDMLAEKLPSEDVKRARVLMLKMMMNLQDGMEEYKEHQMQRRLRMKSVPINPEASLEQVLSRYSKDSLVGMGKLLQLKGSMEALKKAELVEKLSAYLREPKLLKKIVDGLEREEMDALLDLMSKNGVMPWNEFAGKYGSDLEESIYWNYHPPKTLMGKLKAKGLMVEGSFNGKDWVLVPLEVRKLLLANQR